MIIWLASYPRSGNSLLRTMLKSVWDFGSFSSYGDDGGLGIVGVSEIVGHRSFGCAFHEAYERIKASDELCFVKTHEIPIDSQKAIYIVRDGRSASRSYCHYRREFEGCTDEAQTIREIILGSTYFGSWSNHLDSWDPLHRPGTLLLKYEELLENPSSQIDRIADFLGQRPRRPWKNNFEELSRIEPRLFRAAAANRPEDALSGSDLELFWMVHGPWMRRLGYVPQDWKSPAPEMGDSLRHAFHHALATQSAHLNAARGRAAEAERRLATAMEENAKLRSNA